VTAPPSRTAPPPPRGNGPGKVEKPKAEKTKEDKASNKDKDK
jgi:hypothetical protein